MNKYRAEYPDTPERMKVVSALLANFSGIEFAKINGSIILQTDSRPTWWVITQSIDDVREATKCLET